MTVIELYSLAYMRAVLTHLGEMPNLIVKKGGVWYAYL